MLDYNLYLDRLNSIEPFGRIDKLRKHILHEPRYLSIEQAKIITKTYRQNEEKPRIIQRALALKNALEQIEISLDPKELIVGNRSAKIRAGIVSPEAGIEWINNEIESLPTRAQDRFNVDDKDIIEFRFELYPYWHNKGLRDKIGQALDENIDDFELAVKINQKDHSQGHICPGTEKWLSYGPSGLRKIVQEKIKDCDVSKRDFYLSVDIVLEGAIHFMGRYADLAKRMADSESDESAKSSLLEVSHICKKLESSPPESYHEALQSLWFLFVILHMESNANSISPGRMDQYLYPYFEKDFLEGRLTLDRALELTEALWIKFNHIVYMRNTKSAKYFAGFTTGFNVAIGGVDDDSNDATNLLSFIFLKAQDQVRLSQPNLSARIHNKTPEKFLNACIKVIGNGSGMPQIFNDESIIPALTNKGIDIKDARNYSIVGCVELSTHGNSLGWSDAAMFNMVKVLELTLNNGCCLLTGKKLGLQTGFLYDYKTYRDLEDAFKTQINYFIDKMIKACIIVDRMHAACLPSPFLSSVIENCLDKGRDVTAGGALYNFSGVQCIQVANVADSLAAIKTSVYDEKFVMPVTLLEALRKNFKGYEILRNRLLNKIPKYGNDVAWVDRIGQKWVAYFSKEVGKYRNARGGLFQIGLYTVSAHVPMGLNVGATPDGRLAKQPLADGGLSAVYGRDQTGPTALLNSVSRVNSILVSNGSLLNLKFLPEFFQKESNIVKFSSFLRTFIKLHIHHVQFNVVRREDLLAAKKNPEAYRDLLVRVAGYTAYFTELADDLQDEIIRRTEYGAD